MDFDIKTFVIGSLTGLTFGLGIADLVDKDLSQFMSGMGSILGGLGTALAAVVAYKAYKKWRIQTDYTLVHKCLDDLDKIASEFKKLVTDTYYKSLEREDWSYLGRQQTEMMYVKSNYVKHMVYLELLLPGSIDNKEFINEELKQLDSGILLGISSLMMFHRTKDVQKHAIIKVNILNNASTLLKTTLILKGEAIRLFKK